MRATASRFSIPPAALERDHAARRGSNPGISRIPWLLFVFVGALLFPVYNSFNGPTSEDYANPSLSEVTQLTQAGSVINRTVIPILGLVGALLLARNRRKTRLQPMIAALLFAFLSWTSITVLWSIDTSLTVVRLISLALIVLFCAGFAARLDAFSISAFIAAFQIVSLAVGVAFEVIKGTFHPFEPGYRFRGTAPHPNVEAAFLSVATIVLCWFCLQARGWTRVWCIIGALFEGGFLVLTGSRTSLLAVVAALALAFVLITLRDHKRWLPILAISLILVTGAGGLLSLVGSGNSAVSIFASTFHRADDEGDPRALSGRVYLWKTMFTYVEQRPWIGYGFGAFWSPPHIEDVSTEQGWVIQQSHSGYIDEMLALGIPGTLLYVALLFYSLGWCGLQFARHRDDYGTWASVLAFIAIHNVTESISVSNSFTNFTFYALVLYLSIRADRPVFHARMAGRRRG